MLSEPIAITLLVIEALDRLGVDYLIGGSLASALHGATRATWDAHLVADLQWHQTEPLAQSLQGAFYVDLETMQEAVRRRGSFNVIHLDTMFKVDIFIPRHRPFDRAQFERRISQTVADEPERTAYVATAEDVVLAKLEWYKAGGEASGRQWRDVLGVLSLRRGDLDIGYLRHWADALEVGGLLGRALVEAGEGADAEG